MSATTYPVRDAMTMLRRNLKHAQRYPSMTVTVVIMPIVMLLMFVYFFGGALGEGIEIPGGGSGRDAYTNYLAPGILLMTVASSSIATAISVCTDMTEGIINRFRTMAISRSSVLVGHVLGNMIQTVLALLLTLGVALAVGFRPEASVVEWAAAGGLLLLLAFALAWLSAAMGLSSDSVETASNAPMPLTLLPFLGSAIVTPDSMPAGIRWFAEYQPFTPLTETVRGLLSGSEIGNNGWIALAWLAGISVLGYLWSMAAFKKAVKR
ncbi:transport permease protein [Streptomyces longispororuber]|uniref:Transport permease protein n=1 Tax=Streptomyces longispororuber TaxID=68230 RepID=A0A918ZTS5_9ACTN|nr:ABC transporter permease [Streptomyces longispororuber]GHE69739.1 transport permease protein [Streptomyces longispororuber]